MSQPFRIGPWTIEPALHRLCGEDGEVRVVSQKVMAGLVCLASRAGEVVCKEELIGEVWDGAFTSDESLTTLIYELRKALDDSARRPRFIETIRKGGYRLMAEVESLQVESLQVETLQVETLAVTAIDRLPITEASAFDPSVIGTSDVQAPTTAVARRRRGLLVAVGAVALLAIAAFSWPIVRTTSPSPAPSPSLYPETTSPQLEEADAHMGAAGEPEAPRLASLAVLPLSSFGETCGEDGFAGGLSEMLVVDLAEAVPLEVLPSLATRVVDEPWNLSTVVSELDADLVIEGSVIRSGERVWLSVQLVDTASGRLLWGGSYERLVDDALLIQRDLAGSITDEVRRIIVEAASTAAASEGSSGWPARVEMSSAPASPPATHLSEIEAPPSISGVQ